MMRKIALFSGLVLAATMASGCFIDTVDDDDFPPPRSGELTVLWTVDGTVDPGACDLYAGGPTDFELTLYRGGQVYAEEYAACEDFGMTLELGEGHYTGYATLVTPEGDAVTTTLPLEDVRVVGGTELKLDIDFGADSFLD